MALAAWQATITDDSGNVQPSASVEVRLETAGAPLANIYEDRDGATPSGNPATADSSGFIRFHASGGVYRIDATKDGVTQTWRYQGIGLAQEQDNSVPAGVSWLFDDGTSDADPGSGNFRLNHATPASATELYISETDADGNPQGSWLGTLDDGGDASDSGTIVIRQTDNAGLLVATVTGSVTDNGSYRTVPITVVAASGAGSFIAGSRAGVIFAERGEQGPQGDEGPQGEQGEQGEQGPAGEVTSAGGSTAGNFAAFTDATGDEIEDSGSSASDFASTSHNHDGRYYTETELDNGQLDNRYYTESEVDSALAGKADTDRQVTDMGGITVSTSSPSGGSDGDIWLEREA